MPVRTKAKTAPAPEQAPGLADADLQRLAVLTAALLRGGPQAGWDQPAPPPPLPADARIEETPDPHRECREREALLSDVIARLKLAIEQTDPHFALAIFDAAREGAPTVYTSIDHRAAVAMLISAFGNGLPGTVEVAQQLMADYLASQGS